ncbi:hypothetical protein VUR80DRAFT_355 [Thermomyces stellatus]
MSGSRGHRTAVGVRSPKGLASDSDTSDEGAAAEPRRRIATVFDAVAGRISTRDDEPLYAQTDDSEPQARSPRVTRHPTRNVILSPEEALFRRKEAPLRWPHHDIYMAHERDLPDEGRDVLPSSDLLKALHSYASRFYDALGHGGWREAHFVGTRNINERSMDETALLALGILLEEAGRDVLGERGNMVFTEEEVAGAQREGPVHGHDDVVPEGLDGLGLSSDSERASTRRGRKRRKVSPNED